MKWVKEGKKCVLILYRYINNEVMKFENICDLWGQTGEPTANAIQNCCYLITKKKSKYRY